MNILTWLLAAVWLINGLFCKVLGLVPRHELIVARILGDAYAGSLTKAIGIAEVGMAVWILSGRRSRLNATLQMIIVATMNIIEFIVAPDLLLFGKFNALFAGLFILVVYYYEFILPKKIPQPA